MEQIAAEFLDTHEVVRSLTDAGMPEPQAEAVVRAHVSTHIRHLATGTQVEKVQGEVEKLRAEVERLRAEVERLRAEVEKVQGEVEKLRAEVERLRLETRAEIEAAKVSIIKWMVGANVALAALVLTVLQFS